MCRDTKCFLFLFFSSSIGEILGSSGHVHESIGCNQVVGDQWLPRGRALLPDWRETKSNVNFSHLDRLDIDKRERFLFVVVPARIRRGGGQRSPEKIRFRKERENSSRRTNAVERCVVGVIVLFPCRKKQNSDESVIYSLFVSRYQLS